MSGKFSPSKAHRWLVCHASLDFDKEGPESIYAEEGSHAHAILEQILLGNPVLTGELVMGKPAPEERIQQAIEVRDFVNQWRVQHPNWVVETEVKLPVSKAIGFKNTDEFDGTADIMAYSSLELLIVDAKFGFVRVEPKDNPQLYLYTMGALYELGEVCGLDIKNMLVTVMIAQPDYEGIMQFREHRISYQDLKSWFSRYQDGIYKAFRDDDREFDPTSEHACRYCPARATCAPRQGVMLAFAQDEWRMTKTLGELLPVLGQVRKIADDLEALAVKQLKEGMTVPGYKLVESRSIRKWTANQDVIGAAERLGWKFDQFAPHKLLSPAQIEKRFGKEGKEFTKLLAVKPRGGPKLAPVTDPRPEYKPENFTQEEIDSLLEEE
jgi:hypothetical protein